MKLHFHDSRHGSIREEIQAAGGMDRKTLILMQNAVSTSLEAVAQVYLDGADADLIQVILGLPFTRA